MKLLEKRLRDRSWHKRWHAEVERLGEPSAIAERTGVPVERVRKFSRREYQSIRQKLIEADKKKEAERKRKS